MLTNNKQTNMDKVLYNTQQYRNRFFCNVNENLSQRSEFSIPILEFQIYRDVYTIII